MRPKERREAGRRICFGLGSPECLGWRRESGNRRRRYWTDARNRHQSTCNLILFRPARDFTIEFLYPGIQ